MAGLAIGTATGAGCDGAEGREGGETACPLVCGAASSPLTSAMLRGGMSD